MIPFRRLPTIMVILAALICLPTSGQFPPPGEPQDVKLVARIPDGVVFFFEDGTDPDTGDPLPPPSIPLAPITAVKTFTF